MATGEIVDGAEAEVLVLAAELERIDAVVIDDESEAHLVQGRFAVVGRRVPRERVVDAVDLDLVARQHCHAFVKSNRKQVIFTRHEPKPHFLNYERKRRRFSAKSKKRANANLRLDF